MKIAHLSDLHFSNDRLQEKIRCFAELTEQVQVRPEGTLTEKVAVRASTALSTNGH